MRLRSGAVCGRCGAVSTFRGAFAIPLPSARVRVAVAPLASSSDQANVSKRARRPGLRTKRWQTTASRSSGCAVSAARSAARGFLLQVHHLDGVGGPVFARHRPLYPRARVAANARWSEYRLFPNRQSPSHKEGDCYWERPSGVAPAPRPGGTMHALSRWSGPVRRWYAARQRWYPAGASCLCPPRGTAVNNTPPSGRRSASRRASLR